MVCTEKAFPHSANNHFILLSTDLSFCFCAEINLSPVATGAVAFRKARVSLQGDAIRPYSLMML